MNEFQITVLSVIISIYIVIFVLGVKHKIVIYFDVKDLMISLVPWLSIAFAFMTAKVYNFVEGNIDFESVNNIPTTVIILIGVITSYIFFIWTIILSIIHNNDNILLGILIGIFKIISGILGLLILISQIFVEEDEKSIRKKFNFLVSMFSVFIWLRQRLINGKKVYKDKGWELSDR